MSADVTRARAMAIVAAGAALATAGAIVLMPAPPEALAGAVALPHADLDCAACHGARREEEACVGCHGPHPSRRSGHRDLGCATCHDVHGGDGGVRFARGETRRYAVGRSVAVDAPAPFEATVPLVPLERCTARCHGAGDDPIGRCVGAGPINLCFDEHRDALESGPASGRCAPQHGPRLGPWEAARAVATEVPAPPKRSAPALGWLAAGALGAMAAGLGHRGLGWLASRRARRRREAQAEALAPRPTAERRLPVIDASRCLGCYACVDACPYDVLRVERYVAVVDRPEACCGLTLCAQSCPNGSLTMGAGEVLHDHPRLGDDLESRDVPGLFLAGDVTGVPLIKSAILQGRRAVDGAAVRLARRRAGSLDLLIVGAGPAGISAALRARERGLRARVIEQATVAQSIRSFPRGKLVFDQPLELPLAGKLWLERSTKEELLGKWLRIVREERLAIDEDRRFVALAREGEGFVVEARDGEGRAHRYACGAVVLAIGTRGTPRELPIEVTADLADKVFYGLADARSFAGQRCVIVGLGDVAMETAIALAGQPATEVAVVYRGVAIRRGKERNRREIERLVAARRIELLFEAELVAIARHEVGVAVAGRRRRLANDAVFVMIGNVPARPLLEGLGIGFGPDDAR